MSRWQTRYGITEAKGTPANGRRRIAINLQEDEFALVKQRAQDCSHSFAHEARLLLLRGLACVAPAPSKEMET